MSKILKLLRLPFILAAVFSATFVFQNCTNVNLQEQLSLNEPLCIDNLQIAISQNTGSLSAMVIDTDTNSIRSDNFDWVIRRLGQSKVVYSGSGSTFNVNHSFLLACQDYEIEINRLKCDKENSVKIPYTHLLGCDPEDIPEPPEPDPEPPPPQANFNDCRISKDSISDPVQKALFQPEGFEPVIKTWNEAFRRDYPATYLDYPVGSYTLAGNRYNPPPGSGINHSTRGKYISIPFMASTQPYQLQYFPPLGQPEYGYSPARYFRNYDQGFPTPDNPLEEAGLYVTITACPGDFRTVSPFQNESPDVVDDISNTKQCRNLNAIETMINYGPYGPNMFCHVNPGKIYYINIIFQDVSDDEVDPQKSSCADGNGICEFSVNAHVSTQ